MDIDDHWAPGPNHPAWAIIKQHKFRYNKLLKI